MSQIGVDEHTYALQHSRAYTLALAECQGDTTNARILAQYWMRDWYVITDAPQAEYDERYRDQHF